VLAAVVGVVNAHRALEGSGAVGVGCYVVVHLILVWRRAAPVAVCWSVFGVSLLTLLVVGIRVEGLYPEMVIAIAVYTVARHGPLRHLVPIVVVVEILALTASLMAGPQWTAVGFVTFGLAASVLLGLVVRTRRAYLAELEDRARRLERDRDQRAVIAVAAERARIARDMHDIVAHHLSVMVTLADAATLTASTAPDDAVAAMRHVSGTGRQALGEMRRVLGLLHAEPEPEPGPGPQPQPGLADLDALVAGVRAAGLRVEVTVEGVPGELGAGAELAVYRIVQEALTNVLKHAGVSSRAGVRLRYTGGRVDLEVVDDGSGAAGSGAGSGDGRGMTGMAARAAAYGGRFAAGPRAGGAGWSVRATLPGGGEGGP
jgi:signal transduction histidine kinase